MARRKNKQEALPQVQHLTLQDIDKMGEKFDEQVEILVADGKYFVKVDKHFKKTKVTKFTIELQECITKLKDMYEANENDIVESVVFLNFMLLIRHFTSLEVPNDIPTMLSMCEKLINLNVVDEIMQAFDQDELNKMTKLVEEYAKTSGQVSEKIGEMLLDMALEE